MASVNHTKKIDCVTDAIFTPDDPTYLPINLPCRTLSNHLFTSSHENKISPLQHVGGRKLTKQQGL